MNEKRFLKNFLVVFALALHGPVAADQPSRADPLALCELASAAYASQKDLVAISRRDRLKKWS